MMPRLDAQAVKAAVAANLGAVGFLRRYEPTATGNADKARSRCPVCKSPNSQAFNATRDSKGLVCKCFACGVKGDPLAIEMQAKNIIFIDALRALARDAECVATLTTTTSAAARATPAKATARSHDAVLYARVAERLVQLCPVPRQPDVKAYLLARGLYEQAVHDRWCALPPAGDGQQGIYNKLVQEFGGHPHGAQLLKASGVTHVFPIVMPDKWNHFIDGEHRRLVIPWRGLDGSIVALQRRWLGELPDGTGKYRFDAGVGAGSTLFGLDALAPWLDDTSIAIELVEGATDALARRVLLRREGLNRIVLGLNSATTAIKHEWHAWFRGRVVYVATDNDEAGDTSRVLRTEELKAAGASQVIAMPPPSHVKDFAQLLEVSQ